MNSYRVLDVFVWKLFMVVKRAYRRSHAHFQRFGRCSLPEKAKLAREISDGKNEIPHKFLGRKI